MKLVIWDHCPEDENRLHDNLSRGAREQDQQSDDGSVRLVRDSENGGGPKPRWPR